MFRVFIPAPFEVVVCMGRASPNRRPEEMRPTGVFARRETAPEVRVAVLVSGGSLGENRPVESRKRILIVDDSAAFRTSARRMLEAEGYEVVGEAHDGTSGIAAAQELRPELVLLDVALPDVDGFDVASRIAGAGDAPAVVLTSSRDSRDFGRLIARSGARGFIPKDALTGEALAALLA
jgi:CheY-like chemotaxis protein